MTKKGQYYCFSQSFTWISRRRKWKKAPFVLPEDEEREDVFWNFAQTTVNVSRHPEAIARVYFEWHRRWPCLLCFAGACC